MKMVALTNSKEVALIDDQDFELVSQYQWRLSTRGYAVCAVGNSAKGEQELLLMHRLILGAASDTDVDHENHRTLDNQRHNIRLCTTQKNVFNAKPWKVKHSQFKGVSFHKHTGKWIARIGHNYRRIHIGLFDDEVSAARAYNEVARRLFGEFAYLNSICPTT